MVYTQAHIDSEDNSFSTDFMHLKLMQILAIFFPMLFKWFNCLDGTTWLINVCLHWGPHSGLRVPAQVHANIKQQLHGEKRFGIFSQKPDHERELKMAESHNS